MGNKINPINLRIKQNKNTFANWCLNKNYKKNLIIDTKIRKIIKKNINEDSTNKIYTEHLNKIIIITIFSNKPGILIGKKGANIKLIKQKIKTKIKKKILIYIKETNKIDKLILAFIKIIKIKIINNLPYKKVIKNIIKILIKYNKIKGIKIQISGRIKNSDIARKEKFIKGNIPLQTFTAKIKLIKKFIKTKYGIIGLKIWINE